ncbi:phospholipase [Rhodoferax lacus]|uniref:Phospholipase n=1 Tax=Rhodoferax lacus TaxID=2184758 RepID=A0A3E1RDY5_9BURK|nr:PHB depolymerase family esterase [Rhodoferax lacus]RFO97579.1 phospholipase [Rhodoferax lacus]
MRLLRPLSSRSLKRTLAAATRTAVRAAAKAITQALHIPKRAAAKKVLVKKPLRAPARKNPVLVSGIAGGLRYRLFVPADMRRGERLPLMVMLHGCTQDAQALATSTRMNQLATRERFVVLYPEQDRLSNLQGCWNWFQTNTGKAQLEADAIVLAIDHICRTQAIDPERIALAGLSAGAGMAALVATRHPQRLRAVAMHSGIAPGLAHSTASALGAMRGLHIAEPLAALAADQHLPALLVIQGGSDPIVAPVNGAKAAQLWATHEDATPGRPRTLQRGARYPVTVTDFFTRGRLVSTLCEIDGLGHAWSGGAASQAYSDPKGPDASRMIWAFAARQFALPAAPGALPLRQAA